MSLGNRFLLLWGDQREVVPPLGIQRRNLEENPQRMPLLLGIVQILDLLRDEILKDLQQTEKKTIIMVEQNAKKGLEFADIGYVLVSGQIVIAGTGNDLLNNPDVGRLFLGG